MRLRATPRQVQLHVLLLWELGTTAPRESCETATIPAAAAHVSKDAIVFEKL
jgi:hypothetical protein